MYAFRGVLEERYEVMCRKKPYFARQTGFQNLESRMEQMAFPGPCSSVKEYCAGTAMESTAEELQSFAVFSSGNEIFESLRKMGGPGKRRRFFCAWCGSARPDVVDGEDSEELSYGRFQQILAYG